MGPHVKPDIPDSRNGVCLEVIIFIPISRQSRIKIGEISRTPSRLVAFIRIPRGIDLVSGSARYVLPHGFKLRPQARPAHHWCTMI